MSGTLDLETLERLLANIPVGIAVLDPSGHVVGTTEPGDKLAKFALAMRQKRRITELMPGRGPAIVRAVAELVETGEVEDQYVRWSAGDGVTELWHYSFFPITGDDGTVELVGVVVDEVSGDERARSRLRSFESLVEQSTDLVAVATLDATMLYMNRAGRELVGHGPSDPLLLRAADYLTESSRAPDIREEANDATWNGRLTLKHVHTGEPIAVDATFFVVREEETNTPLFRAAVMRDVRRNEMLLQRLKLQVDRMPVALITVDAAGLVRAWNPAAATLFGYSLHQVLGMRLTELVGCPALGELIAGPAATTVIERAVTAAGERLMVQWSMVPLGEVGDDVGDVMLIGQDQTERLRVEGERNEALRVAAMATWTADPVSGEVAWSDELYRMIGVDPHRFTPTFASCWRLLDPSERARVRRLRRRLALSPRFRFTFQIVRPGDGVGRWLEVDGHKVGARGRMIGTARDVTVQRRAADRLRELDGQRRELLERMLLSEEEERGRIARALHDDTVQLMAALQINLDRIQSVLGGEPPAATTLVTQTRNALSDALERTRHLMFELRPQRFDRHGLQYAIGALCEQVGLEAGFTATIDVPERRFDGVIEDLCYRTVREAVINARKHSGADAVEVGIRTQDGIIHGFVTDNGRGFDPLARDRSHLRLHMGLEAMAERLRLAGGSSEVASHVGEGCTVSFTIPYDAAPAPWEAVV